MSVQAQKSRISNRLTFLSLRLVALLSSTLLNSSCSSAIQGNYQPSHSAQSMSYSEVSALTGSACSNGGKQYAPAANARVSWKIARIKTATGENLPFTGTNIISGGLGIIGQNLDSGKAVFNFLIDSTDTDDKVRDDRIIGYLFRENALERLQVRITGFKEVDLKIIKGSAIRATALGTFAVDTASTKIEIPMVISETGGVLGISTSEPFKLKLRELTPTINGLDLSGPISRLLSLVEGIDIQNTIEVSMNFAMSDVCSKIIN